MRNSCGLKTVVLVVGLFSNIFPLHAAEFYVGPKGNDGNAGTEAAPFATLARAQQAVRALVAQGLTEDVQVVLRAGTYRLTAPLLFGPEDSGSDTHSITYTAYPDEIVVISGGVPVSGWQKQESDQWTCALPKAVGGTARQLFINGKRMPRGRYPNAPGLLRIKAVSEDLTEIVLEKALPFGDLADSDAELVMYQNWSISRAGIEMNTGAAITIANPMGWVGHGPMTSASPHKPAYLEHALAFVDVPGEWYLDPASKQITYQAASGENLKDSSCIVPISEQWIVIEGTPDAPVRNLHFKGLQFRHTTWTRPAYGYNGIQAGHHGTAMDEPTHILPVAIELNYARDCSITECIIAQTGACGIGFGAGTRNNKVQGCILRDIGGNGIMVGWRGKGEITGLGKKGNFHLSGDWLNPEDAPVGNVITGNHLRQCGAINHGCVGIFDAFAQGTLISHNRVHGMPYTGISVGFRWNETETSQRDTTVEYNHVYDCMRMLADGGCLYTLGYQPGTVIRGNVFHEVHRSAFAHGGAPNNGIFFDQGSKGYHVVGNTIYDTSGKPIRFNQTNKDNLTWENNSFGVGVGQTATPD